MQKKIQDYCIDNSEVRISHWQIKLRGVQPITQEIVTIQRKLYALAWKFRVPEEIIFPEDISHISPNQENDFWIVPNFQSEATPQSLGIFYPLDEAAQRILTLSEAEQNICGIFPNRNEITFGSHYIQRLLNNLRILEDLDTIDEEIAQRK